MQGQLREKTLSTIIKTECAHCNRSIIIEFDHELNYKIIEGSENLLAFFTFVDFEKLTDPSIIDACGVDALQCVTGCTFGKGNLIYRDYGKHVFTIYCRSSRSGVRVYFHGDGIPEDLREDRSALTKWIMSASRDSLLSIEPTSIPEPEPAKIRKSISCSCCGENVMESRINQLSGKPTCIPCFEKQQQLA